MVNTDKILVKIMANLWLAPIIGSILIVCESILSIGNVLNASFSIIISIIVITSVLLSRRDVHGTGFIIIVCAYVLLLSPLSISGFELGYMLIIIGALFLASGGLYTIGNFFFYVAIGAIVLDLVMVFLALL